MQSRYYDPVVGRFINADDSDILSEDQGNILENNLFTYCLNNPVNMSDKNGEYAVAVVIAGVAAAVALTLAVIAVVYMTKQGSNASYSGFWDSVKTTAKTNVFTAKLLLKLLISVPELIQALVGKAFLAAKATYDLNKIKNSIPSKLKLKNGKVDISKFKGKGPLPPKGPRGLLGPLGYYIVKDLDSHNGGIWKLFNWAGKRVATLLGDGTIIKW